jgi:hypothetical protein
MAFDKSKLLKISANVLKKMYETPLFDKIYQLPVEKQASALYETLRIILVQTGDIKKYVKGTDLVVDDLSTDGLDLKIDQFDYYAFTLNMIDQLTNGDIDLKGNAIEQYARKLNEGYHKYLAATAFANAGKVFGTKDAPITFGTGAGDKDVVKFIMGMGKVLTDNKVPMNGRWLFLDTVAGTELKNHPKFMYTPELATKTLVEGTIGMFDGATVVVTSFAPEFTSTDGLTKSKGIILAHELAGATSTNMTGLKQYDPGRAGFADEFKDMLIYGGKIAQTDLVVGSYIKEVEM